MIQLHKGVTAKDSRRSRGRKRTAGEKAEGGAGAGGRRLRFGGGTAAALRSNNSSLSDGTPSRSSHDSRRGVVRAGERGEAPLESTRRRGLVRGLEDPFEGEGGVIDILALYRVKVNQDEDLAGRQASATQPR